MVVVVVVANVVVSSVVDAGFGFMVDVVVVVVGEVVAVVSILSGTVVNGADVEVDGLCPRW